MRVSKQQRKPAKPKQVRGKDRQHRAQPEQMEERIDRAEELLLSGFPPGVACRELQSTEGRGLGLTKAQAVIAVDKAILLLADEFSKNLPHYKVLQVHRLHTQIAAAMGKEKMNDAIRGEAVLSQILGTRAPTKVHVSGDDAVKEAIANVAASMTQEQREALIEEQLELEKLAATRVTNGVTNGANGVHHG